VKRWLAGAAVLAALSGAGRGTVDGLADALAGRVKTALEPLRDRDVLVLVEGGPARLARDLGELVSARLRALGARSAARGEGVPDAAKAKALGWDGVVRIALEQSGGRLRLTGSVTTLGGGLWGEPGAVLAHVHADAAIDDELRAYGVGAVTPLPQADPPKTALRARGFPVGDLPIIALDAGLGADGKPQLVGTTATEVVVFRVEAVRVVELSRFPIAGKPAPVKPRGELATVSLDGGTIAARSALAAEGVIRPRTPLRGFRFPGLPWTCDLVPGLDQFSAESCAAPAGALPDRFWAAVGLRRAPPSPVLTELAAAPPVVAAIVP
jgi:hypothetical protein